MIEFYRGLLLASAKTHVTNIVSWTIGTLVTPTPDMSVYGQNKGVKEVGRHIAGLGYGFLESVGYTICSRAKHIRSMGTKLDGLHPHMVMLLP